MGARIFRVSSAGALRPEASDTWTTKCAVVALDGTPEMTPVAS